MEIPKDFTTPEEFYENNLEGEMISPRESERMLAVYTSIYAKTITILITEGEEQAREYRESQLPIKGNAFSKG